MSSASASTPSPDSSAGDDVLTDLEDATLGTEGLVLDASPEQLGGEPQQGGLGNRLDAGATGSDAQLVTPAQPFGSAAVITGAAGRLPASEQTIITRVAREKGVDPLALAAIRVAENGGPGREFGVLSEQGKPYYVARVAAVGTFEAQAEVAADSLLASERRFRSAGLNPKDGAGHYTPGFWEFFGARWAPRDAANDPRGLNRYWVSNVIGVYQGSALG